MKKKYIYLLSFVFLFQKYTKKIFNVDLNIDLFINYN